jgi:alkanesulfonate monooxygenase SsuD/methylene tetrahydromethanopterin reductase-like flavin-dependent oxidoreductase (luciferase family)
VQQPHPPTYIAATRTRTTLEFVVSTGHPLIIGVVLDHVDALDLCHRFVAMSEAVGHGVPMSRIPFFRYFYVGDSEEQVRRDTRASLDWTVDMIQWRGTFPEGSEVNQSLDTWRKTRTALPSSYDYLSEKRAVFGTPESCVAKIRDFQQQGIEYFGCNFAFGGMEHKKVLRSMELFAKEVMPQFAS